MTNNEYLNSWLDKIDGVSEWLGDTVYTILKENPKLWKNLKTQDNLDKLVETLSTNIVLSDKNPDVSDERKAEVLSKLGFTKKNLDWEKDIIGARLPDGPNGERRKVTPGVGLSNEDIIYLSASKGMTPRLYREAMDEARQKWLVDQKNGHRNDTGIKRQYLYHLTLGDDAALDKMKNEHKKNKELMQFFKDADKEMGGVRGWSAALARNISQLTSPASVFNKYADDVLRGTGGEHENTLGGAIIDYPRQLATDVGHGIASVAASIPAVKAGGILGKKIAGPIGETIGRNVLNGVTQGALELARQKAAGEDLNVGKGKAVGTSQATLPTIMELGSRYWSKVPILGRLFSRYLRNQAYDPLSMKRQAMKEESEELMKLVNHPEVNNTALKTKLVNEYPKVNDKILAVKGQVKSAEDDAQKTLAIWDRAKRDKRNMQARMSRVNNKIKNGEYTERDLSRLADYENQITELTNKEIEARLAHEETQTALDLLRKTDEVEANKVTKMLRDKANDIDGVLKMSDDDIINHYINTPSEMHPDFHPYEQELFRLISDNQKAVTRKLSPLEENMDLLAHVSNNFNRSRHDDRPPYQMSKYDRWEDIGPTEDEARTDEYINWLAENHPELIDSED